MTTTATTTRPQAGPLPPATSVATARADRGRVLAFVAPLALFAHGILAWVRGLAPEPSVRSAAASADPDALTRLTLVVAVAALCWLTASLADRLEHLDVAMPATVVAAFGAGAAGSVWLGTTTGVLDPSLPAALTVGGPVLIGLALAVVLAALTIEGRLPVGSAALALAAGVVLALPWDLLPLGALLLLIALGPLTRPREVAVAAQTP